VTIDSAEFDAADDIYENDLDQMAANIKDALPETAAMALGRKYDEILFAKMQATDWNAKGQQVGAFNAAITPATILQARRKLFEFDAPVQDGMIYCGLPTICFDTLMSYEVFANSQWTGGNLPFSDGLNKRTWRNINFFELPVHLQSVATTDGKFYLWHKSGLGTGHIGDELKTGWEYILNQKKWYYQSTLNGGATIIEDTATGHKAPIIEIRYKADAEPTFT